VPSNVSKPLAAFTVGATLIGVTEPDGVDDAPVPTRFVAERL